MKINKLILALAMLIAASFFLFCYSTEAAESSPDAIAIRVMPNTDHYSPLVWYGKNIKLQGSPQNLFVDGYEAVRDGRTVYVNAANVSGNNFYTNIYIISYNQDAENPTIDIFGQILSHWKFNINISDNTQKQKIIRDVKRLANLYEMNLALANYKADDFPRLKSGSYVAGASVSVWPSWQATLAKELAITMPLDPINKLGACPAGYDAKTCWNQTDKKFYFNFNTNSSDELSIIKSNVYWYKDGGFYVNLEESYNNFITDPFAITPEIESNLAFSPLLKDQQVEINKDFNYNIMVSGPLFKNPEEYNLKWEFKITKGAVTWTSDEFITIQPTAVNNIYKFKGKITALGNYKVEIKVDDLNTSKSPDLEGEFKIEAVKEVIPVWFDALSWTGAYSGLNTGFMYGGLEGEAGKAQHETYLIINDDKKNISGYFNENYWSFEIKNKAASTLLNTVESMFGSEFPLGEKVKFDFEKEYNYTTLKSKDPVWLFVCYGGSIPNQGDIKNLYAGYKKNDQIDYYCKDYNCKSEIANSVGVKTAAKKWNYNQDTNEGYYGDCEIIECDKDSGWVKVDNQCQLKSSFTYVLKAGENYLSLALNHQNNDMEKLFNDKWKVKVFENGWKNVETVETIILGKGFVLTIPNDDNLTLYGDPVNSFSLTIQNGWNLAGFPIEFDGDQSIDACNVLQYLQDQTDIQTVVSIFDENSFDKDNVQYKGKIFFAGMFASSIDTAISDHLSSNFEIQRGRGYFINLQTVNAGETTVKVEKADLASYIGKKCVLYCPEHATKTVWENKQCQAVECENGYKVVGGVCVKKIDTSCAITNGVGQSDNSGSCQVVSCNTGYHIDKQGIGCTQDMESEYGCSPIVNGKSASVYSNGAWGVCSPQCDNQYPNYLESKNTCVDACGSTDGQIDISDTVKITKTVSGLAVSNCFVKDGKFYIENNIKKELASATSDDKGDVKFNNIDTEDLIYNNNECKFAYYGDVSNASCSGSGCPKICSVNPESIQCITVPWNKVVSNFLDIDKIDKLEANNVSTVSKASDCFSGLTLAGVAAGCTATCSAANQPNCQVSAPANSEAGSGVCCGAGSCYKCKNNYSWSSSACAADTQTVNCTAKPANADWNTSATVLQTWSGSAWQPSNASAYSAVAGTCKFKCSAGYSWDASDSSCKVVVKQTACKEIKIADHANDVNGDRINIVFSMDTLSYTLFGNTISNKDQIMNVAQEFKKVQPYASYLDKFNFWVIDIDVGGVDWYNSKYGANKSTLASPGAQTETDFLWITDAQYSSYEDYLGGYQLLVSEFCPGFKKIQGIHISSQYGWGDLLIGDKTRFGVVFLGKQLVNTKNLFHELGHSIGLVDEAYDGGWDASQGDFWDLGNNVLKNSQGYYLGSNYKWGDLVIGEEEHTYYSSVQYKSGTFSSFRPSDTYFMGEASSGGFGANSTEGKYSDVVERLICRRLDSIVELDSGTYCKTKYDNDLGCNQYGANNSYNIDFNQPSEFMFSGKNNPYPEISKLELLNCK